MRVLCVLGIVVLLLQPALAQEACGRDKLGVSRTVLIDTAQGPQFGAQHTAAGFLADGEVVLTFDDGPSRAYTKPVLDALAAHCTKATFFMVGRMAVSDPAMVKEVARQGHTVATHTWSHANLQQLTPLKARAEIEMGVSAVQAALGKPIAPFFRFPYLRDTKYAVSHLQGRQISNFSIDIDSKDYLTKSAEAVHARVLSGLAARRKGIILFHDIQVSTAAALPRLLAELKARSYRVVHISPKAEGTTSPDFDLLAQQEAERRRLASAGKPLAKRSITWPTTVLSEAKAEPSAPKAAPRPPAAPRPDDDWMTNVFRR